MLVLSIDSPVRIDFTDPTTFPPAAKAVKAPKAAAAKAPVVASGMLFFFIHKTSLTGELGKKPQPAVTAKPPKLVAESASESDSDSDTSDNGGVDVAPDADEFLAEV